MTKTLMMSAALATAMAGDAFAQAESQDPIKLTTHDWTGQLVTTRIMGEVLADAGYNVEYVQADYIAQFAGLKTGDLHVAMEIWETTGRACSSSRATRWRKSSESITASTRPPRSSARRRPWSAFLGRAVWSI